jgi:group I intron endonuclease
MPRKKKKFHYIYKTTNLINEKYYIGMHSTDNLEDGYIGSGKRLWYSINKYGKENFKCEILEILPNRNSLKKREKELINEDLLIDPMCMNLQIGGGGGLSSIEHKKKFHSSGGKATLHLLKKYRENHIFNLKNNLEYRKKYLDKIKDNLNWIGRTHKEDSKKKMSESKKGMYDGEKNPQFGTCWITNEIDSIKIKKGEIIPEGWRLGRKIKK